MWILYLTISLVGWFGAGIIAARWEAQDRPHTIDTSDVWFHVFFGLIAFISNGLGRRRRRRRGWHLSRRVASLIVGRELSK